MYYEIRNNLNRNEGQFTTKEGAVKYYNNHIARQVEDRTKIGSFTVEELENGINGYTLITINV